MVNRSALVVAPVVAGLALAGCLIDRSSIGADDELDAGGPRPDGFVVLPDVAGLDAPGLDAAPSEDDAFVETPDAWTPGPIDAWSPPCIATMEVCNARDDDCNGTIDEAGCSISSPVGTASCTSFVIGVHVYLLCKASPAAPWDGARTACQLFAPYDLARIDDNDENTAISGHVREPTWIGLNDRVTEGSFVWADGAPLGAYASWARMAPDRGMMGPLKNCVTTDGLLWRDEPCGTLDVIGFETPITSFLCEAPIRP